MTGRLLVGALKRPLAALVERAAPPAAMRGVHRLGPTLGAIVVVALFSILVVGGGVTPDGLAVNGSPMAASPATPVAPEGSVTDPPAVRQALDAGIAPVVEAGGAQDPSRSASASGTARLVRVNATLAVSMIRPSNTSTRADGRPAIGLLVLAILWVVGAAVAAVLRPPRTSRRSVRPAALALVPSRRGPPALTLRA